MTLTTSAGTQSGATYAFAGINISTAVGAGNNSSSGGSNDVDSSPTARFIMTHANGFSKVSQMDVSGNCIRNITNGGENPSVSISGPAFGFTRIPANETPTSVIFYWIGADNETLHKGTLDASVTPMTYTENVGAGFPFDFASCPGTVGTPGTATEASILGISLNDTVFSADISWDGAQGTGHLAFAYKPGTGCATIDLAPSGASSTFANAYGYCASSCASAAPVGTESICYDPNAATGSGVHDGNISLDGTILRISGGCFTPLGAGNSVAWWQIGTTNVLGASETSSTWDGNVHFAGHASDGVTHTLQTNNPNPNIRLVDPLSTANLGGYTTLATLPSMPGSPENHCGWPHPTGDDSYPWLCANELTTSYTTPVEGQNEIYAVQTGNSSQPILRFGSTFATGTSTYFGCQQTIGYPSQDGKWYFFLTDDLLNLGTDANGNPLCSLYAYRLGGGSTLTPTVTLVSPNVGTTAGGTSVTISGTNFATGATATFDGIAATSVVVVNSTTITAVTPADTAGAVTVAVTVSGQTGSLNNGFTYIGPAPTVTSVSPNNGPTAGGTAVTISGTNFATGATATFDGIAATSVVVVNSTTITAVTPADAAGAVTVAVTVSGQTGSLSNGFTYTGTGTTAFGAALLQNNAIIGAGQLAITFTACDNVNGNTFVSTGREILLAKNTDTNAHTFTVTPVTTPYGGKNLSLTNYALAPAGSTGSFSAVQMKYRRGWVSGSTIALACSSSLVQFAVVQFN